MRQVREHKRSIGTTVGRLRLHRFVIVCFLTFLSFSGVFCQKVSQKKNNEPEKYSLIPFGRNWNVGIGGGPTLAIGDLTAISDGEIR